VKFAVFAPQESAPRYAALARDRLRAESQGTTLRAVRAGQESLFTPRRNVG